MKQSPNQAREATGYRASALSFGQKKMKAIITLSILMLCCGCTDTQPRLHTGPLIAEPTYASDVTSYPESWDYAQYPYRIQADTQGSVRVHGVLTFHNWPKRLDIEITGTNTGTIQRNALGTFEWRGPINRTNNGSSGTGWIPVGTPSEKTEKRKSEPSDAPAS